MALVGIYGETSDCIVDVWAYCETHHILNSRYAFVTPEIIFRPKKDTREITLCFHGAITTEKEFERARKKRRYRQLFADGDNKEKPENWIYSFDNTFSSDTLTNQCYEGPEPFRNIKDEGDHLICYGVRVEKPKCTYRAISYSHISRINITGKNEFSANKLYCLRFGYFLKTELAVRKSNKIGDLVRWMFRSYFTYPVHLYSYPFHGNEETVLRNSGCLDRIKGSKLYLVLEPFIHKYLEENGGPPPDITEDQFKEFADDATSVIFVILPRHYKFKTPSEILEKEDVVLPNATYVLFTTLSYKKAVEDRYQVFRIKPRAQFGAYRHLSYICPRSSNMVLNTEIDANRPTIAWTAKLLLYTLIPYLGVFLIVTISLLNLKTGQALLYSIISYFALALFMFILQGLFPGWRRRFR